MEGGLGTTMFSGHKHTNRSLPVNNKLVHLHAKRAAVKETQTC